MEGDTFVAVCADCGIAITTEEIGGELDGRFVDYIVKRQGAANFVLCLECWERFKDNSVTEIEDGIQKRYEMLERVKNDMNRYL